MSSLHHLRVLAPLIALGALYDQAAAQSTSIQFENMPRWYDYDAFQSFSVPRPNGTALATLDLDGDGGVDTVRVVFNRIEVARYDQGGYSLAYLLDTFSNGPFFELGQSFLVIDVDVADMNGDGLDDIVVCGREQVSPFRAVLCTFLRSADGFVPRPPVHLPWQNDASLGLKVAEIDGDRRPDVLVWEWFSRELLVRLGAGPQQVIDLPGIPGEVATGDLDGDGFDDLVILLQYIGPDQHGRVQVRYNDGAGGFSGSVWTSPPIDLPGGLTLLDANGDGHLDIATTTTDLVYLGVDSMGVMVHLNDGSGGFGDPVVTRDLLRVLPGVVVDLQTGDLNGDGVADLVISSDISGNVDTTGGTIVAALGRGDGRFFASSRISSYARGLALADLEGDGRIELLGSNGQVIPVDGRGRIGGTLLTHTPELDGLVYVVQAVLDCDGDGLADVASYDGYRNELRWHLSQGNGTFVKSTAPGLLSGMVSAMSLDAADVDGDGWEDLILVDTLGTKLAVWRNQQGTFSGPPVVTDLPGCHVNGQGANMTSVAFGDLDGDGWLDFVAACRFTGEGMVGRGLGNGGFSVSTFNFPEPPGRPVITDVTGDGLPDLLFQGRLSYGLWVLPGDGMGSFGAGILQTFDPALGIFLTAVDLDGDGDLDLAANLDASVFGTPAGAILLHNDGTGIFTAGQELSFGYDFDQIHASDLDGDGWPDLVLRQRSNQPALHVLRNNRGFLRPEAPAWDTIALGQLAFMRSEVDLGDFDGDGRPDLVIGGWSSDPSTNHPMVYFSR